MTSIYFNQNQKVLSDHERILSEIKKEQLDKEAQALDEETKTLKEERDRLQAEKAAILEELRLLAPKLDDEKRKQVERLATDLESRTVTPTTPTTNLPARVYFRYLRSQQDKILPIIEGLRKQGFLVFPTGVGASSRKNETFVGYYFESDKAEAEQLLAKIRDLSSTPAPLPPQFIRGGARPRHYDVWFAFP